jgi:lysozyme
MNKTLLVCIAVAGLIVLRAARAARSYDEDSEDQTGSVIDQLPDIEDLYHYAADAIGTTDMDQAQKNLNAMMAVIRKSEGTAAPQGYFALFGWPRIAGRTFTETDDHPRQFFTYTNNAGSTIRTSAAGAYQITATTYDALMKKYPGRFTGFDWHAQDAMAEALIEERGAMPDIAAGRFERAIEKLRPIWASLPGAGANQPERSLAFVKQAYLDAGGVLA